MKTVKIIINIILGLLSFMVFNESDTFLPNIIGLFCIALLIAINVDGDAIEQIQKNK